MKLWVSVGVVAVVGLLAGCGDDDGGGTVASSTTPPRQQQVQKPKPPAQHKKKRSDTLPADEADSGVEGVPIPASATPGGEGVWTVPGVGYLEVVDWYEDQTPEGQDLGSWAWCDTGGGAGVSNSDAIHSHIYARGTSEILGVSVANGQPVEIIIGVDQSGPC